MKYIIGIIFFAAPCLAMGNLPPRPDSDPATWGDVKSVQSQVTSNAQQEQVDAANINNRLDDINKLKLQIGTTVRLYDAKYASINFFSFTDIQGAGGNAVGMNIGFKLGKSYEERQIAKLQKQMDALIAQFNKR